MSENWKRAQKILPGGVSAPVRSFGSVDAEPIIASHGDGAFLYGDDGKKYVDYFQSQGSLILGHAHPAVVEAIGAAAAGGISFGLTTELEIELAEQIASRVAGIEMVRFVTTGSDATQAAIRLARAVTDRENIVRFSGNYHGNSDLLMAGTSKTTPQSSGIAASPKEIAADYNAVPTLDETIAAVIVEPIAANMGIIPPAEGFLKTLRDECSRVGALLIFDEVVTGFRVGFGGASEYFGVTPDLWCYGKVLGGGLPLGAIAGARDLMENFAPLGNVYSAGTMAANPVALAAGIATLAALQPNAYEMLRGRVEELRSNLQRIFDDSSVPVQINTESTLLGVFFSEAAVTNEKTAYESASNGKFAQFFRAMLNRGILLPPTPYGGWFVSLAHTWQDIDWTTDLASAAAAELR